jgi:hypothetical protein
VPSSGRFANCVAGATAFFPVVAVTCVLLFSFLAACDFSCNFTIQFVSPDGEFFLFSFLHKNATGRAELFKITVNHQERGVGIVVGCSGPVESSHMAGHCPGKKENEIP